VWPTMASPTARPSPVQGEHGQVKIRPGSIVDGTPRRGKGRTPKGTVVIKFATSEMLLIGRMHGAVVEMYAIMMMHPSVRLRDIRSQIGAIAGSGTEKGDDAPASPRPRAPSATETSLMDAVFEMVVAYAQTDLFGAKLVLGRGLNRPWKDLAAEDRKRRSRSMLAYIRNNALYRMALSERGRRVQQILDTIALDKLDRK
jgi:hypothetical protein